MKRLLSFLAAGLLAACSAPDSGPGQTFRPFGFQADAVPGVVCRIGREGGPVVADRGIGGTGGPLLVQVAAQIADRGIGGTGMVGVITGFASICINGLEVHYDDTVAVDIDGTAVSVSALRAGQIVVIRAEGSMPAPYARTISIRNELVGRVELMTLDPPMLMIAGQPVSVPAGTLGAGRFGLGDWITVSGLRRKDGVVVASRLDAAATRKFTVRGLAVRDGSVIRVGNLVLDGAVAKTAKPGQFVTVSGSYVADRGQVDAVVPDPLSANPAAYFGPSVDRLIVQAYVRVAKGTIWLNGVRIAAGPGVHRQTKAGGLAIVSLERRPDGTFIAVDLRFAEGGADQASHGGARPLQAYASLMTPWLRHAAAPASESPGDVHAAGSDGQTAPALAGAGGDQGQDADWDTGVAVPEDLSSPPAVAAPGSPPAVVPTSGGSLVISSNAGSWSAGAFPVATATSGTRVAKTALNDMRQPAASGPTSTPNISLVSGVAGPVITPAAAPAPKAAK
jgi:Domain of unknown function (DUF5666)